MQAYHSHLRQVMDAAGWAWPESVLTDEAKAPRFVHSVQEFLHELRSGCHMDEILVFPDGLRRLGQVHALDQRIRSAAGIEVQEDSAAAPSGYEMLARLEANGMLCQLKGKIGFIPAEGAMEQRAKNGPGLSEQWESLQKLCPEGQRASTYVSEMRLLSTRDMPTVTNRRHRRSALTQTMRECVFGHGLDARDMLYWDDYSEGTFIGGDKAGYLVHADCIQTSNVGSLFSGHKLLAIWQYPEASLQTLSEHVDTHFIPPLQPKQEAALARACKVALAPPGCVYLFSGCNAHAVCNVGWTAPSPATPVPRPALCVASYEALGGLHPRHATALARTHDPLVHFRECWMDSERDLDDFEEDLGFNVHRLARRAGGSSSKQPHASAPTATVGGEKEADEAETAEGELPWAEQARRAVKIVRGLSTGLDCAVRTRCWRGRSSNAYDKAGADSETVEAEEEAVPDLHELWHRQRAARLLQRVLDDEHSAEDDYMGSVDQQAVSGGSSSPTRGSNRGQSPEKKARGERTSAAAAATEVMKEGAAVVVEGLAPAPPVLHPPAATATQ